MDNPNINCNKCLGHGFTLNRQGLPDYCGCVLRNYCDACVDMYQMHPPDQISVFRIDFDRVAKLYLSKPQLLILKDHLINGIPFYEMFKSGIIRRYIEGESLHSFRGNFFREVYRIKERLGYVLKFHGVQIVNPSESGISGMYHYLLSQGFPETRGYKNHNESEVTESVA